MTFYNRPQTFRTIRRALAATGLSLFLVACVASQTPPSTEPSSPASCDDDEAESSELAQYDAAAACDRPSRQLDDPIYPWYLDQLG